jgi:hypothetical protein
MAYSATALQLTHVLQTLFRRLGGKITLATGGSTTTAIDTKLEAELEGGNVDDLYNGGTLIIIEDAGGAFAAPEGEASRIIDYDAATTTITVSPALTAAVASGDRILIAPPDFPLYDMIEVVNDGLKDLGELYKYDTSITTAANQTEYTLPLAVKGGKITNVEIQGTTTDANDNRWQPIPNWKEGFANAGSTGTFRIKQYPTGYNIRIEYKKVHPRVSAYADYIDEFFHPKLVEKAVLLHALMWRNSSDAMAGGKDPEKAAFEQQLWTEYERARAQFHPEIPPKQIQPFPAWGSGNTDEFPPIPLP